jgi:hypothetical protein
MEMVRQARPASTTSSSMEFEKLRNFRTVGQDFHLTKSLMIYVCIHLLKFNDLMMMVESLEGIIIKLHVTTSQIT